VIITIPSASLISADNIEKNSNYGHIIGPLRSAGLDDRGVLALWLLLQRFNPDDAWRNYIQLLPDRFKLSHDHILLSEETLPGSSISSTVEKMRSNITRQLRSVLRAIRRLDELNVINGMNASDVENEWLLCHTLVMSRSGLFKADETVKDWTEQPLTIVPFLDFANHSDDPSASITVNKDGSVALVATQDIKVGEEITISYWPNESRLTSEQSLFTFGFLSDFDKFVIPGITFDDADVYRKRAIQRLIFIDGRPSVTDEHVYTDNIDAARRYFSIESMDEETLTKLIRAYVAEEGIGEETLAILKDYEDMGEMKLTAHLHLWKETIESTDIKNRTLRDYKHRLVRSIKLALDSM